MSKHFSLFTTESQYQAGITSLDFPNVSLVEQTGNVHYSVAVGPKELWDADFGDIIIASSDFKTYIKPETYNLDDYPLSSFEPIAVCIYDRASRNDNKAIFMSTKFASYTTPYNGVGNPSSSDLFFFGWGDVSNIDGVLNVNTIGTTADSSYINNEIKKISQSDYTQLSYINGYVSSEYYFPAFYASWLHNTIGTSQGDWILPSWYDLSKYSTNFSQIKNVLTTIKNVAGSDYLNITSKELMTCNLYDNYSKAVFMGSNGSINNYNQRNNIEYVRPILLVGPEEL